MDLFNLFVEKYEAGLWTEAMQVLLPNPNLQYDSLSAENKFLPYLVNFADACVFRNGYAFNHASRAIHILLDTSKMLKLVYAAFIQVLLQDDLIHRLLTREPFTIKEFQTLPDQMKQFFILLKNGYLANEEKIKECRNYLPQRYRELFAKKLEVFKGWELLNKQRPEFCTILDGKHWLFHIPWIPYAYPLEPNQIEHVDPNKIPLIFYEPLQRCDHEVFFKPFRGKEMILAIETLAHLFQMLQFPAMHALLQDPKTFIYVMEFYPEDQFRAQGFPFGHAKEIQPFFMSARPHLEAFVPALSAGFQPFFMDAKKGEGLYDIAKKVLFNILAERYGKSRCIPLNVETGLQSWNRDTQRSGSKKGFDLNLPKIDYLAELIEEKKSKRQSRPFNPTQKIRLTHVVPQIVDGGHAPTKLLKVLCENGDTTLFDISIISTERMIDHIMNYPPANYVSTSSLLRGTQTIKALNQLGIPVWIDEASSTFESTIDNVGMTLSKLKTDIVVFHGPDEINQLVSASCDVPFKIFFEHGTPPSHGCFDFLILGTEEAYTQNQSRFQQMGMESCYLPFAIDLRKDWKEELVSRKELGLPEEAFVMTTISSHLETRVTPEMKEAIVKILQRCPQAYYAPMGKINDPDQFLTLFKKYEITDKVKILGNVKNPSHYARSMNLYLNEFPFGSCLGMLDAMAAGCPVVSMYEETGPQQGRYAGTFMGLDHVIKNGRVQDYIDLTCQLIQNKDMYNEWSTYTLQQYEKRVDVKQYVRDIELFIKGFIELKKDK